MVGGIGGVYSMCIHVASVHGKEECTDWSRARLGNSVDSINDQHHQYGTVQYSKAVGWINSAGILDTRRAAGAPFRVLQ